MTTLIPCARVSTREQGDSGTSLDSQIAACLAYIARLGAQATLPISEDVSGMTRLEDRPKGAAILAMLSAGTADGVVWYTPDRFFRDNLEAMIQCRLWLRAGVELHFCDTGQVRSENDIAFLLRAWQASDEREKIRERTMRGRVSRVREGNVVLNKPPFGYRVVRGRNSLTLEVFEPEAGIIRLIFEWYVYGDGDKPLSMYAIACRLQEMGIPSRGDSDAYYRKRGHYAHWNFQQVHRIITSETYAGVWYYQRTAKRVEPAADGKRYRHQAGREPSDWIPVQVPALISRELWLQAQARIEINKERSKRNRKHDYLLSHRVRCLLCGRAMSGSTHSSGVARYKCVSSMRGMVAHKCPMPTTRCEQLDAPVWEWCAEMIGHPDRVLDYLQGRQEDRTNEWQALEDRAGEIQTKIVEHEEAVKRLLRLYSTGKYTEQQLDELTAEHHAAIGDLTSQARKIADRLIDFSISATDIEDFEALCEHSSTGIAGATLEDKLYYLEKLDVSVFITLEDGARVAYTSCRYGTTKRIALD